MLMPPVAIQAAERVVVMLELIERRGNLTFGDILPYAQDVVSGLTFEHPEFAGVVLTIEDLATAYFRVAARQAKRGVK
jgi:hypothetical protein